jgi:choline-sulfatase
MLISPQDKNIMRISSMSVPNILLVMADQFRFDATGLNGGWAKTPCLDRLAREGVNYTNCYANSPICMPTRITMATGLYPHNTNVWSNIHYFLPTNVKSASIPFIG